METTQNRTQTTQNRAQTTQIILANLASNNVDPERVGMTKSVIIRHMSQGDIKTE